jgi:hypothetical protein
MSSEKAKATDEKEKAGQADLKRKQHSTRNSWGGALNPSLQSCIIVTGVILKDLELTEVKKKWPRIKQEQLTVPLEANITFCAHVGWDGVLVLFFMLIIAALFGYITYEYTVYFNNFHREFVWLFMLMGGLYLLSVIFFLIRWKKIGSSTYIEEERKNREETKEPAMSCVEKSVATYNNFQIGGRHYLWQLYTCEIAESINQMINVVTVYTCSFPVGVSSFMCILLSIDCFHTASFMVRENTSNRRDRQIVIDTAVDFLCAALPPLLMWFGYSVPISVSDMVQIAFFPAVMMLIKLDTIFESIIRSHTGSIIIRMQEKTAARASRRRKSLFQTVNHYEIAKQQQADVLYAVHMGAGGLKFLLGFLFLLISIYQLAQNEIACKGLLWDSCVVKTPFCGNMFHPSCNCALLNVQTHNWTILPDAIYEMNALKVMKINHGPLGTLPSSINEMFKKLKVLDFSYNKLTVVPETTGEMKLSSMTLSNNNLAFLPHSVWVNENIFYIELDNNNISIISASIENALSLSHIFLSNNSLTEIPNQLFELNVITLFIDGNKLCHIPSVIGQSVNLRHLKLNNNRNISNVPESIGKLARLHDIDLRNNAIEKIPHTLNNLRDSLKYIYIHRNPICSNGWLSTAPKIQGIVEKSNQLGAGCEEQCSAYCQNRYLAEKKQGCARDCNSVACDFYGGKCNI